VSTKHVRATDGKKVVLAVSDMLHREGRNQGRVCQICKARWTVQVRDGEDLHVWRDGISMDSAILDWTGNNAVVECCDKRV